jgi:hypothetical protein
MQNDQETNVCNRKWKAKTLTTGENDIGDGDWIKCNPEA